MGGWLHIEIKCRLRESNPHTVTHPSTNRAQRRLTSLIEINTLPLRHAATHSAVYTYGSFDAGRCWCQSRTCGALWAVPSAAVKWRHSKCIRSFCKGVGTTNVQLTHNCIIHCTGVRSKLNMRGP